jgi:type III secretory pathway component EscS
MPDPEDQTEVLSALRLGWYLAELRGRSCPHGPTPQPQALPARTHHALPLRIERSPRELRLQVQAALMTQLGVLHIAADDLSARVTRDGESLRRGIGPDATPPWDRFTDGIYQLDARIQDQLAARSETQSCAYQLGRGLAEIYWELTPDGPNGEWTSWAFLLGRDRCHELTRLAGRLSCYFDDFTMPAVVGTLRVWQAVAAQPDWCSAPSAYDNLYQQARHWYDLLILQQPPATLIAAHTRLPLGAQWRCLRTVLATLWPQLLAAAIGLLVLVAAITLIANGNSTAFVKSALAVFGTVGVSLSTVQAKLKNEAQNLAARLRQRVYTDLITISITSAPNRPGAGALKPATVARLASRPGAEMGVVTELAPPMSRPTITTAAA